MSLLADIVTRWGQVPQLVALVPSDQVVVGEPIVGWPVPAVALTGYTRTKQARTSSSGIDVVSLRITIEASSANDVEAIVEAIREYLFPAIVGSRRLVTWTAYSLDLTRDPTSEHYIGAATYDLQLW
jgi:hypothetical protein